jgi:hypothetical protein
LQNVNYLGIFAFPFRKILYKLYLIAVKLSVFVVGDAVTVALVVFVAVRAFVPVSAKTQSKNKKTQEKMYFPITKTDDFVYRLCENSQTFSPIICLYTLALTADG